MIRDNLTLDANFGIAFVGFGCRPEVEMKIFMIDECFLDPASCSRVRICLEVVSDEIEISKKPNFFIFSDFLPIEACTKCFSTC